MSSLATFSPTDSTPRRDKGKMLSNRVAANKATAFCNCCFWIGVLCIRADARRRKGECHAYSAIAERDYYENCVHRVWWPNAD